MSKSCHFLRDSEILAVFFLSYSFMNRLLYNGLFYKIKYDLRGYIRSSRNLKIIFFCNSFFCLTPNLFKTFQDCQHFEDAFFYKMKYALKGHPRSYKTTLMLISLRHNFFINGTFILLRICFFLLF